jgi:hypothetical protein
MDFSHSFYGSSIDFLLSIWLVENDYTIRKSHGFIIKVIQKIKILKIKCIKIE